MMRTTLCDPPVTHPSCDILAGRALGPGSVLAGPEALGRSRYCRECLAWITAASWATRARQGWIPLPCTYGDLWMVPRTAAGGCQGPPRKTKPFGFEDTTRFLFVAFLPSFLFGLEYELSVSLACILVKSSQNLRKTL